MDHNFAGTAAVMSQKDNQSCVTHIEFFGDTGAFFICVGNGFVVLSQSANKSAVKHSMQLYLQDSFMPFSIK